MKHLLLILAIAAGLCCCKNDNDTPTNPIDQLPPPTQTGANTFGCLLDGEAFIPSGGTNPLDCVYQLVNGEYFFGLQGNRRNENNNLILIGVATNNLEINENNTYALAGEFSETNTIQSGELTITHLDMINQTVSGTFFFDIIDQNGNFRKIREGRFDMQFTK